MTAPQGLDRSNRVRIGVWLVLLVGGGALGIWLDLRHFRDWFLSPGLHAISALLGLMVMWGVGRVSRNTGRYLARHGRRGELPPLQTNQLVTTGPYGCMRHPMHLGLLFLPLGVALLLGSPTFVLIVAPLEMGAMLAMIRLLEEPEAIAKFGEAYREYRRQVPGFNLRPACLKHLFGGEPEPHRSEEDSADKGSGQGL